MRSIIAGGACGLVFGVGIVVSGMVNPAKVLNFFDVLGTWDPSLVFVMAGGLVVTFLGYRIVLARERPLFEPIFDLPTRREIDLPLVIGSAMFGLGWGLTGFCPGGLVPALGLGRAEPWIFLGALSAGIVFTRLLRTVIGQQAAPAANKPGT